MPETLRTYHVHHRYLHPGGLGWQEKEKVLEDTTLEEAWRYASSVAHDLDREFGDSHFWTVDVKNPQGEGYVQLFHGRLE